MLFTSPIFLFLFLPIALCVNFMIRPKYRNSWLCLASLFFYFWDEGYYTIIMIISISINYFTALAIFYLRIKNDESKVRWLLGVSVSINLILLCFFKYTSFLVEIVDTITLQRINLIKRVPSIHLPLGISFFTFHGLSYIIDVYRNEAEVEWNPITIGLYFSFFPQLIAGPIVRYHGIAKQLTANRKFDRRQFAQGIVKFIIGLSKKALIANTLGAVADSIYGLPSHKLDFYHAWLGLLTYFLQIYIDFSSYSDIAIGLGYMFGIRFPENFNYPYISRSISEFWKRWHISLSSWFRDYLYISLGGSRVSKLRLCFNVFTVSVLCGLWHGASWNFIVWGLCNGTFLALEQTVIFRSVLGKMPRFVQHLYTMTVATIGSVVFRSPTLTYSIQFSRTLLGLHLHHNPTIVPVKQYMNAKVILVIIFAVCGSYGLLSIFTHMLKDVPNRFSKKQTRSFANLALSFLWIGTLFSLFLLCIITISSGLYNPFIYFRF